MSMPKRDYLPRLEDVNPTAAIFSVRGRKDPIKLVIHTAGQLAVDVPFRDTGRRIWLNSRATGRRHAEEYQRCRSESDINGLRKLAAMYLKLADEMIDAIRLREWQAREDRKFVRMLERGEV